MLDYYMVIVEGVDDACSNMVGVKDMAGPLKLEVRLA